MTDPASERMADDCPACGATVEAPETTDFVIREVITTVEVRPQFPGRLPAADDRKVAYPPEGEPELSPRFTVGNRTCPGCETLLITMEENRGEPDYGDWPDEPGR